MTDLGHTALDHAALDHADLVDAYARARAARPDFAIAHDTFLAHLASKIAAAPGTRARDVEVEDLYLAYACGAGDHAALAAFEAEIVAKVPSYVRRLRLPSTVVDEVKQLLRAKLLMAGPNGAPPKVLGYSGRGKLASWVRVGAIRAAFDLCRDDARNPGSPMHDDATDLVGSAPDPEVELLRIRYREHFEQAVCDAVAALPARQRALLRLQHVDGLNGEQIGGIYGVNRSTVSRWLASAHQDLLAGIRGLLMKRAGLTPSEFDSLARLVMSHLHVSARTLLAPDD
jgi:RNA polymerase sigma-70 factor (ECF subfamily)